MLETTLCLLKKDNKILLAMKKGDFEKENIMGLVEKLKIMRSDIGRRIVLKYKI